jgi:hypothetical protein
MVSPVHESLLLLILQLQVPLLIHLLRANGQCAVNTTMIIVVTTQVTPTFTQLGPLCQNSAAPTLPLTSNNGITGTWSPATINTATAGTTTYTFTPANGQCAVNTTMIIVSLHR